MRLLLLLVTAHRAAAALATPTPHTTPQPYALKAWQSLESRVAAAKTHAAADGTRLPLKTEAEKPRLTLYRDTNGWCPFCERVWIQLEAKKIPYDEQLVDLRDKPQWWLDLAASAPESANPSGGSAVPAVRYEDGTMLWESAEILTDIERRFPDAPSLVPAAGSAARAAFDGQVAHVSTLASAGVGLSFAARNSSLTQEELAHKRAALEAELDALDKRIDAAGGPFMAGSELTTADCMYAPLLERWASQLPLTSKFVVRGTGRWPALDGWFEAMEASPAYAAVRGDRYSWVASVSAFQRIFAVNGTMTEEAQGIVRRADAEAAAELRGLAASGRAAAPSLEAAARLVKNRAAVIADAVNPEPRSQKELRRLAEDEAELVEATLLVASAQLCDAAGLAIAEDDEGSTDAVELLRRPPHELVSVAKAARYVASRLCVPRDMSAPAGSALRATLLELATQAESRAWQASGGML